jgi:predicted kinase
MPLTRQLVDHFGDPCRPIAPRRPLTAGAKIRSDYEPTRVCQFAQALINDNPRMESSGPVARLIIVCGLPGSGKTTLAKALEQQLRAIRFSADDWMDALAINLYDEASRAKIEALQWKLAQQLLGAGLKVIIEWGTWGQSERDTLRLGARALGAGVELHYLAAPEHVLLERIQRRGMENPPITRESLSEWLQQFQAPTSDEMALFDDPLAPDFILKSQPE